MEDVRVREFIGVSSGTGYGSGSGSGSGYGDGDGCGTGYGYGYGTGYGDGYGSGSGSGYGYGDGDGCGTGYGYGYGTGYGDGEGSGDGSGVKAFCNQLVYMIDEVPTLIDRISHGIAKGRILNRDLTTTPCYVMKSGNTFAHGETLRKAREALLNKLFEDMPEEERIEAFVKEHKAGEKYLNRDLFEWHNRLTGSCEAGRMAFVRNHGIDLEDSITPEEFIKLCENDYGGSTIKKLKEFYSV